LQANTIAPISGVRCCSDADRVCVFVDDELMPEGHLLLEVLNIPCGGPRLRLARQADPGDSLFDIVALEPFRRKEMLRWLKCGDADEPPPFTTRRGRKITLAWDGTPLHVDDDRPEHVASQVPDIHEGCDAAWIDRARRPPPLRLPRRAVRAGPPLTGPPWLPGQILWSMLPARQRSPPPGAEGVEQRDAAEAAEASCDVSRDVAWPTHLSRTFVFSGGSRP
jgi:hypothetical protein